MISKILTFFRLSRSIVSELTNKEKMTLVINIIFSVFNTFLELASIITIVYLLLVISGQQIEESGIISYINSFIDPDQLIISAALLMISVVVIKTI